MVLSAILFFKPTVVSSCHNITYHRDTHYDKPAQIVQYKPMKNMLTGAEAPAQMQPAFGAIRNLPLIAFEPAPLTCQLSTKLAALNMPKTADMKQNSFRIGKGVLMRHQLR